MREKFERAYEDYLVSFSNSITPEQRLAYRKYALSNRERGEEAVQTLTSLIGRSVKGMNCLDVGSGYGGLLLALASEGASVIGVEYAKDLFELSQLNVFGEPASIPIYHGNILDSNVLPEGRQFDLIAINDVFEHIYEIDYLFKRLAALSHDDTVIYFEIPNHRSYHAIRKEHHKFIFGLTMLDLGSWAEIVGPFSIYHRPFSIYKLLFKSIGFDQITLSFPIAAAERVVQRTRQAHISIANEMADVSLKNERLKDQMKSNFERLRRYFEEDTMQCSDSELFANYEAYVWSGIVSKRSLPAQSQFLSYSI